MTYLEHIRNFNDAQLAYFLTEIQPETTIIGLVMSWALSDTANNGKNYDGPDPLCGLDGDARYMLSSLRTDFDKLMKDLEECRNESLDRHHDYAVGNDIRRMLGMPTEERELPKAPEVGKE